MATKYRNEDDRYSSLRNRGKKRKLEFLKGEVALKKPKTAPVQRISATNSQSDDEEDTLHKHKTDSLPKKGVPESNNSWSASKKSKETPLLTKRATESNSATVVI